jgi:hypothetical protein
MRKYERNHERKRHRKRTPLPLRLVAIIALFGFGVELRRKTIHHMANAQS